MRAGKNGSVSHDHLEDPYRADIIDLGRDEEGPVVATLISRTDSPRQGRAVLYIHGFSDYFFHPHVAGYFVERGYAFYAIDLRKAGRSLRPHQTPHYVKDPTQYFADLDAAARIIRAQGNHHLLVYAHSAGGLTASLWAHRLGKVEWLQGLVLNSPFIGFGMNDLLRKLLMAPVEIAGLIAPAMALPPRGPSVNVVGLHADFRGEWDFNLAWKPYAGTPIRLGWLRGIHRAQRSVHQGLDVRAPVLVAVAQNSLRRRYWTSHCDVADTVLDPNTILRWAPKIGTNVATVRIAQARHDLALSKKPARERFFGAIDAWLVDNGIETESPTGRARNRAGTPDPADVDPAVKVGTGRRTTRREREWYVDNIRDVAADAGQTPDVGRP